jgi:hypothetical protein
MYRSKSARSGYSYGSRDAEADSNEIELNRLQQRFRIAEGERKASREEKELTKRKQLDEIRKLEREQSELHKNFSLAVSKQNKNRDSMYTVEIQAGIDRTDELLKEIEQEKQVQAQLDADLRRGDKRNQNIRVKSASLKQKDGKAPEASADRQRNDLEGRLYRANAKYNDNLTKNGSLRKEIETLVIEHRNFETANKKLEKKLNGIKQEINQVMEASSMAHEQREEAKHKTILLRERAEKDLAQYATDIKDLQRSAENDFILKEFMDLKNQEREEKAHGSTHAKKARRREMELLLQKCSTSWSRIQEISGTDDLEVMLDRFTETERENFGLFNFINELNNIIEEETEEIEHVKQSFKVQSSQMVLGDEGRLLKIENLKEEVESEKEFNSKKRSELEDSTAQFDELRSGLQAMITQLDIDFMINTNADLMSSLGEIEERLNELIAAKAMMLEELDPENVQAIRHILVPEPPALPIEEVPLLTAPSTGDLSKKIRNNKFLQAAQQQGEHGIHDIDIEPDSAKPTENMPLTIDQMREKVKNKRAGAEGGTSQRAFMRKQSMKPAPEVTSKADVDT